MAAEWNVYLTFGSIAITHENVKLDMWQLLQAIYHERNYKFGMKYCSGIKNYGTSNGDHLEYIFDRFNVDNICT
jgi:hypothetical protein